MSKLSALLSEILTYSTITRMYAIDGVGGDYIDPRKIFEQLIYEPATEPQIVAGSPNTVTLDMNGAKIARFEPQLNGSTYSINVNFRLILSGASNGREISIFPQLSGTRIIDLSQFGSNCKVSVASTIGAWVSPNLTITAGTDDPILIVGIYNKSNGWWDLSINEISL